MLKKKVLLVLVGCMMVSTLVGCSKGNDKGQEASTDSAYTSIETDENGISSVEGTMSEKKDFMFTVEDKTGAAYGFSFDEKPENYDKFKDGDKVVVEFTGEISEVEAFSGEIVSIKWK